MPALRLSHKLFLAFALIAGVVLSLACWSLLTTRQLTAENRTIIDRALPAVRLEVALLEGVAALRRLEARHAVLRDPAYARLFAERARWLKTISRCWALWSRPRKSARLSPTPPDSSGISRARRALPLERAGSDQAAIQLETLVQSLYGQSSAELHRRGTLAEALEEQSRLVALLAVVTSLAMAVAIAAFASAQDRAPPARAPRRGPGVERRKLSEPIPVRGRDEIADLTIAFNRMATRLRELDALKQHLFSAITHDLRTPLTVIAWSAERLGPGRAGNARRATRLAAREHPDEHPAPLSSLVNQLLDLGKLKTGKLQLDLDPTDFASVVQEAVDEIRPWAEDRSIRLDGHGVGLDPEAAPGREADPPGAGEPPRERGEVQQGRRGTSPSPPRWPVRTS